MIGAIIPAAVGAAQLIGGLIGRATNKRPKYEIPAAVREAVAISQLQAASPYAPGYGEARTNVDISSANALLAAQNSGNAAGALQGIVGQQQAANRGLNAQNLEYQAGAQGRLQSALGMLGQHQEQEWQLNKFAPFADRQRLTEDMIGGGITNIASAGNMLSMGEQMGLFKFGGKGGGSQGASPGGALGGGAVSGIAGQASSMGGPAAGIMPPPWLKDFLKTLYIN